MKRRRPDHRKVKQYLTYTADQAARLLSVCKGTIRRWLKSGLHAVDDRRPALIRGVDLAAFLKERRKRRTTCPPGQFFCFRCRGPRASAGGKAEYIEITPRSGNLRSLCAVCGCRMYRRTSRSRLAELAPHLTVTIAQPPRRLRDSAEPCVNDHLGATQ